MNLGLIIYLFGLLNTVRGVAQFFMVAGVIATVIIGIAQFVNFVEEQFKDETKATLSKWHRRAMATAVICGIFFIFVPDRNTAALIYILPKIAASETIKRDIPELYDLAVKRLKEEITNSFKEDDRKDRR